MELVRPAVAYKDSYINAVREFLADQNGEARYRGFSRWSVAELEADFPGYVALLTAHSEGRELPEGFVPHSTFWLVDADEVIGQVSLRHELNEHLREVGGHIGYAIVPKYRKQGYGTKILALALLEAKKLGLEKVLITCDVDNQGSRKIIESNGGVLEDERLDTETGVLKLRFWIEI